MRETRPTREEAATELRPRSPRREFIKRAAVAGAAAASAGAAEAMTGAEQASADAHHESESPINKRGYRETERVKTYYRLARI